MTLSSVFVPTNHIYIGDVFLLGACRDWFGANRTLGNLGNQLTPRRSRNPSHDCSPRRGLHAYRVFLGGVPRSRSILCRPVPNPNRPIRTKRISATHAHCVEPVDYVSPQSALFDRSCLHSSPLQSPNGQSPSPPVSALRGTRPVANSSLRGVHPPRRKRRDFQNHSVGGSRHRYAPSRVTLTAHSFALVHSTPSLESLWPIT